MQRRPRLGARQTNAVVTDRYLSATVRSRRLRPTSHDRPQQATPQTPRLLLCQPESSRPRRRRPQETGATRRSIPAIHAWSVPSIHFCPARDVASPLARPRSQPTFASRTSVNVVTSSLCSLPDRGEASGPGAGMPLGPECSWDARRTDTVFDRTPEHDRAVEAR
jgi:hypothetical protein